MSSGEGTTHNTNGLLVQRIWCVDDGTESIPCINSESKHLPKNKKRTVDSPPNIFSGHHYNRSIRANNMIYEALVRLRWKAFLEASSAD